MDNDNQAGGNESTQAITAFEQILELVPDDMFALEALHDAYLEKGETEKAYRHLRRLAELAGNTSDYDLLIRLSDKLFFLEAEHPEASQLAKELEEKAKRKSDSSSRQDSPQEDGQEAPLYEGGIHQEIALAWKLYEQKQISKDEYTSITNDLTETSAREIGVPVSVMHALYDRAAGNTEKILAFIVKEASAPLISLGNFDIRREVAETLPLYFLSRLGAIPIDFIGNELMVAVLNPFNQELKDAVERTSKRKCHFYLVTAPDYDRSLENIKGNLEKKAE